MKSGIELRYRPCSEKYYLPLNEYLLKNRKHSFIQEIDLSIKCN
jgi:hypothetical protein